MVASYVCQSFCRSRKFSRGVFGLWPSPAACCSSATSDLVSCFNRWPNLLACNSTNCPGFRGECMAVSFSVCLSVSLSLSVCLSVWHTDNRRRPDRHTDTHTPRTLTLCKSLGPRATCYGGGRRDFLLWGVSLEEPFASRTNVQFQYQAPF